MNPTVQRPIIHIIDSLGIGGAEMLLKNTLGLLPNVRHVVIFLNGPDTLQKDFPSETEFICLHYKGLTQLPQVVYQLSKLIKKYDPYLVHSHLFTSNLLARLAVPKKIPLLCTLHSVYSKDAFEVNRKSVWIERLTLKKHHNLIGVSKYVLKDYLKWVKFQGQAFVLYNFLPDQVLQVRSDKMSGQHIRCIAIGNLKESKNYTYLLKVWEQLKDEDILLDIYGEGNLNGMLQQYINNNDLKVNLKGATNDIKTLLPQYDLFIQASVHEGFGISVIEAMAAKVPLCISDIPVFREITNDLAHFFPLNNAIRASLLIKEIAANKKSREAYISKAFLHFKRNFSQQQYLQKLISIYSDVSNNQFTV